MLIGDSSGWDRRAGRSAQGYPSGLLATMSEKISRDGSHPPPPALAKYGERGRGRSFRGRCRRARRGRSGQSDRTRAGARFSFAGARCSGVQLSSSIAAFPTLAGLSRRPPARGCGWSCGAGSGATRVRPVSGGVDNAIETVPRLAQLHQPGVERRNVIIRISQV